MSIPKRARANLKNPSSSPADPRYDRAIVEQLGQRISQKILADRESARKAAMIIERWLRGETTLKSESFKNQKRKL